MCGLGGGGGRKSRVLCCYSNLGVSIRGIVRRR